MAYLTVSEFKTEVEGTQYVQADLATDAQIESAINRASDEVDSYLRQAGYDLPLVSFGNNLRGKVLDIAIYWLASATVMLNTEDVRTNIAYLNYRWAVEWLEKVAAGKLRPDATDSDTSNDDATLNAGMFLVGKGKRGW